MNTNEDINKDSAVNTLEIENNEDELKQLNSNESYINNSTKNKNRKKFINFSTSNCDKILIIILLLIIFFFVVVFFISITLIYLKSPIYLNNEIKFYNIQYFIIAIKVLI